MDSALMDLTQEQQRALGHARNVLAEEKGATALPDAEWRRMLRLALLDLVQALEEDRQGES
jgi:hypothetical protein